MPKKLGLILAAAFLIRIAYLFFSQQSPFYEPLLLDPAYYHGWAMKIAHGQWTAKDVFYGLPLYPYFLGIIYLLTAQSLLAVKIIHILLGLGNIFLIFKLGEKMGNPKVGLVAAGLAAFYGPFFFHEGILIPEALGLFLYTLGFYLWCRFWDAPSVKRGLGVGFVFGLAALTKAGVMLFLVIAVLALGLSKKKKASLLAVVFAFMMTLLPVTLHNVLVGKDWVWLTSHSGLNFYIGNNPESEGVFKSPEGVGTNVQALRDDSRAIAERDQRRPLKPSEVSRYWSRRAWEFVRNNPADFSKLSFRKIVLFFDGREISDVDDYQFAGRFNPMMRLPWPNFAWLAPLFFLGLFVSVKRLRYRSWAILWIAAYIAGITFFFVNARYRIPILGLFFPFAAVGILETIQVFSQKQWKRLLLLAGILAAAVLLTQARLVNTNWIRDYINAGDVYIEKNEFEKARGYYEEALKVDPRSARANQAMGVALTKMSRSDEAKYFFEQAIAEDPLDGVSYNNLGLWYDNHGDSRTAERYFVRAIELKPASSQAHNNLGMVYGKRGEYEKAMREFEISLGLNPDNPRVYTNIGLIHYRLGRREEARAAWRRALEINPAYADAKRALDLSEHSV
ncbi:MAG: tetratricopeptide repeat protein [Candidatus Omnitrophica bacterium]|nr:tetratricopeptide repeat protein [Candidatus Omnitrophota bacterium]